MNVTTNRRLRGKTADYSGRVAEEQVAQHYCRNGAQLLEKRWRSKAGEIDLIFAHGDVVVFVEVKSAKCHATAAHSLGPRQQARILAGCEAYVGTLPNGLLTEMRVDVALVAGGEIQIIEDALGW